MTPQPPPGQPPISSGQSTGFPPRPQAGYGPPPGMLPSPMMYPPQPAARGNGVFYSLLVALATSVFLFSLGLNFLFLVLAYIGSGEKADPNDVETVEQAIVDGNPSEKVAVIRLDGMILDKSKREFITLLDKVGRDPSWRALVIEVDSPGGGVTQSDEIYDAILRFKQARSIPVVVSMNSLAASGGYYVSMAADRILAQETTLTGSIGVIMSRIDVSGFADKYGIKDGSIVSDGADFKNAGSMTKPLTPAEEAYFKSVLNDAFGTFKARIAKGRPNLTSADIDAIANGKIYSAHQALRLKLIDQIGYIDDAVAEAGKLASLSKPHAIRVERKLSTMEQLFGAEAASRTGGANVGAGTGGLSLSITPETVEAFTRPRLMYLWSGN